MYNNEMKYDNVCMYFYQGFQYLLVDLVSQVSQFLLGLEAHVNLMLMIPIVLQLEQNKQI